MQNDDKEKRPDPLSMFRIDGQIAVVTGAGSGIGRAVAHALAGVGASVVVADIDLAAAEKVASEITASGAKAPIRLMSAMKLQ